MSDTPKTDAEVRAGLPRDQICEVIRADFARAQERRIADTERMLLRCEMWLGTIPEGRKMQLKIRALFPERSE